MIEITQELLEKLRLIKNHVLVRCDRYNENIKVGKDKEIFLDVTYEPERHSSTHGTVFKIPEKIDALSNTIINIEIGDDVHFHYLTIQGCHADGRAFAVVQENSDIQSYYAIPYQYLYCAVRRKLLKGHLGSYKMIPLNNWILVEPVYEELEITKDGIATNPIAVAEKRYLKDIGIVAAVDPSITSLKIGEKVLFTAQSDIPIEYDLHQSMPKKYFRMLEDDIMVCCDPKVNLLGPSPKKVKELEMNQQSMMGDLKAKLEEEEEKRFHYAESFKNYFNENNKKIILP